MSASSWQWGLSVDWEVSPYNSCTNSYGGLTFFIVQGLSTGSAGDELLFLIFFFLPRHPNKVITGVWCYYQDWSLELEEVFLLERRGEFDRFARYRETLKNRMLLWHGEYLLINYIYIQTAFDQGSWKPGASAVMQHDYRIRYVSETKKLLLYRFSVDELCGNT